MHSLLLPEKLQVIVSGISRVTSKFCFKNFPAVFKAIKVSRLQQRGPPKAPIQRRLSAVILLESPQDPVESGVESVIKLMKMPVPIPAPHAP